MTSIKRRWITWCAIAGAVVVALLVASRVWKKAPGQVGSAGGGAGAPPGGGSDRVVPVAIAAAHAQDVPVYLEGLGSVLPLQTVTVRSQVDGRLDKVLFEEGQRVRRGDVLAEVDPRPFLIQLHQGEAALARDEAQRRNAELNLNRYKSLRGQSLVAQQQVDDQQTAFDQSSAATLQDRATLENARLQLAYARITSPLDGVTGVRLTDPGNLVHPSDASGIVVITQLDPISVLFTLPADQLPEILPKMQGPPLSVEAQSRDGNKTLAKGDLKVIDNQIDAQTSTIRLKATFPNGQSALWPHQFVKAKLLLDTLRGALVIPSAAVQRGPTGTFVYVAPPDNVAQQMPVDIERTVGELSIVRKGISAGDRVVTDGQSQLRPGAKVAPRP